MSISSFDPVAAVLLIPIGSAALLAVLPGYRLTARLNVIASLATFLSALSLFVLERPPAGPYVLVDDLNIVFIVLNTFVGFMAGYNVEGGIAWGLVGATIATVCTFAPSFVFIISGAPLIDRIRATGAFAASLNGITIAVVGVIAGLAVFVARHAAFDGDSPDWLVIVLGAVAFVAVWRFRVGVVTTVACCAAVGLSASLIH